MPPTGGSGRGSALSDEGTARVRVDDGTALWTATTGSGPPLLLCHGGPGAFDTLGPVASLIDDLVTVTRWDQRGCGRSDPVGPHTIDRMVADMEALRAHLGVSEWLVGGHSWGANLAVLYAQRHPERVTGLLYLCGTGLEWWSGHAGAYHRESRRRWTAAQARRVDELFGADNGPEERLELRRLQVLTELARPDEELADAIASEELERPINTEAHMALNLEQRAINADDAVKATRAVTAPALLVHGEGDPRSAACIDTLAEALPNGRRVLLPGAGHYPWAEAPEALRAELRGFLREVVGG